MTSPWNSPRARAVVAVVWGAAALGAAHRDGRAQVTLTEREGGKSYSATIAPRPATLHPRARFQIVDRDKGLPQNSVQAIVQDRAGFIWLGTQDGVARYDGRRFVVFRHDPDDRTSLSSSFVTELLVAKDGTVWVGTEGGGLNHFRSESSSFERFLTSETPDTANAASILSLREDADGRIWIGTQGRGVFVLDPRKKEILNYSLEDGIDPVVTSIVNGADGSIWFGAASGVYRFDRAKNRFEPLAHQVEAFEITLITALIMDRKGDLWIGTDDGLARYAPRRGGAMQVYSVDANDWSRLSDGSVKTLYEDRAGRIWVGTETALHVLDPATGTLERHMVDSRDPRSLPDSPSDIYEDAAGVVWVGMSYIGGAALLDPRAKRFRYYKTDANASGISVAGDHLWISSFDGVCHWRGTVTLEGECYKFGRPTQVLVDRAGTAWVGTMEDGLFRLDRGAKDQWTVYQHDPENPRSVADGPFMRLHEDRKGRLWAGLLGGGLQRFNRATEEFIDYELPTNLVYTMKDDPAADQLLWVGTGDRGLLRLNVDTNESQAFIPKPDEKDNKTDNSVVDFWFEGDKAIWIATYGGGLKRLDRATGAFKSFRRQQGMPSDTLYSVQRDRTGKLWLSSLVGLIRFDPATESVHTFTMADGLQSDEFILNSAVATRDGRLVVGGIHGFNIFRPEEIASDNHRPPMRLTSVDILGERYRSDVPLDSLRELEIDHDEASVTIEFAALSFSGSDQTQFSYQVDNGRWLPAGAGVVSLAGLDSGNYTLRLGARTRHGVESEPRELAIAVAPPPWRTWWAYTAYGVAIIGLLLASYRYQRARIDRVQKLARLATVEKDYEVTAAVQSWFLPQADVFESGPFQLVGFYRGAEKCSGDWWWYEDLGGGRLWVIVADVTGHGAGAAMLTAAVATGISIQSQTREDVINRLARVNKDVLDRCKRKATIAMTVLVLNYETGEVQIYTMGGLPALFVGLNGEHMVLSAAGTPLGSVDELQIGERSTRLGPGDRLVITTDGIIETAIQNGRQLGVRRFVNMIRDVRSMSLNDAAQQIVREVDQARSAQPQEDDFTFCLLERRA